MKRDMWIDQKVKEYGSLDVLGPMSAADLRELVRLADDIQAKLNAPEPQSSVTASFASAAEPVIPEVQGAPLAPAPEVELPLTPLVSEAPPPPPPSSEPARRVAMPGAPVAAVPPPAPPPPADTGLVPAAPRPAPEPPSRALVIPREPTRDDADAQPITKPRPAPPPQTRIEALEPDAIKTIREPPAEKKNHTLLWVLAATLLVGGLAAGGYYLYESSQNPTSGTVTATWSH